MGEKEKWVKWKKVTEQYIKFDLTCVHVCICIGKYMKHAYQTTINKYLWIGLEIEFEFMQCGLTLSN